MDEGTLMQINTDKTEMRNSYINQSQSEIVATGQCHKDSDIHTEIDPDNFDLSRDLQKYLDNTNNHLQDNY